MSQISHRILIVVVLLTVAEWSFSRTVSRVQTRRTTSSYSDGWHPAYQRYIRSKIPNSIVKSTPNQVKALCPKYGVLRNSQKEDFWAHLIEVLSLSESGHRRTLRYKENGLGRDPVTGTYTFSEGLLQLSYADSRYWKCDFNWSVDQNKGSSDPSKSIFHPYKQFDCAFNILHGHLVVKGRPLVTSKDHYWSTLIYGRKGYNRLSASLKSKVAAYCY